MPRKKLVGKVISDKMNKTRIVMAEYLRRHSLYGKYYRYRTKFYVHDEKEISKIGDIVLIEETRPLSKLKRWRLLKIINEES